MCRKRSLLTIDFATAVSMSRAILACQITCFTGTHFTCFTDTHLLALLVERDAGLAIRARSGTCLLVQK
jgi:hypothetical protein